MSWRYLASICQLPSRWGASSFISLGVSTMGMTGGAVINSATWCLDSDIDTRRWTVQTISYPAWTRHHSRRIGAKDQLLSASARPGVNPERRHHEQCSLRASIHSWVTWQAPYGYTGCPDCHFPETIKVRCMRRTGSGI
ncbi:hypothetical protein N656DRAFT_200560 [Canariomyces notabilis]|uniref:Uncharacterized protein n=1 Tax=Canariomyces notabilis TaxID=2074819 RepID=A0AAN6QM32_9PEZI|nr:hypothetical protein N656DRAFT_200560 [Canariomyces arenarius]